MNFRWLGAYEGAGGFQMERGINVPAAVKCVDGSNRRPAIIISSSPYKKGSSETPWQDFFDTDNGHIRYYGDNKDPGNDPAQALGNKALLKAFQSAHSFDPQVRATTPPLLFFKRKRKGYAVFQGFGVIQSVHLLTQWDNVKQRTFTNYAFDFTVFNLESEHEEFDWTWIRERRNPEVELSKTNMLAPKSWQKWLKDGSNHLNRARRRVSKLAIEKREAQKPIPGSEAETVLRQIYEHYGGRKHRFEALAELVTEKVIGAKYGGYNRGWITAAGGDGGADFVASVSLGSEFSTAKIVVLGQAKCVALDSPTHGNHIARTVARLKRGWIGAFVTTSYFSDSVQQEVIEDKYPIVLINGKRLAEEVAKIVHEDDRYESVLSLLDDLSEQYEGRIQHRQPEEILNL
ncbi:MAG: restriction endonuclease [Pseudomonadota bacterium]